IQLLDMNGNVLQETLTDNNGDYLFGELLPGEYQVLEITPPGLLEGGAQAGQVDGQTVGQVADHNRITAISLLSGDVGEDYEFCDFPPAIISGTVYHDKDNDGQIDADELERIAGVTIELLDATGMVIATTTTGANGNYEFQGLSAGTYTLREIHPSGWLDGLDTAGTIDDQPIGQALNPGDLIQNIVIGFGQTGVDYNFGEILPVSLAGTVHADYYESNCYYEEARDELLPGVTIELLDASGTVIATTTTDEFGRFEFNGLQPGEYAIRQIQPEGYFDGNAALGFGPEDDFLKGEVSHANLIEAIFLESGEHADFRFCEDPPVEISGFVYQDGETVKLAHDETLPEDISTIRDGLKTPDDMPLAGVQIVLRANFSNLTSEDGVYLIQKINGDTAETLTTWTDENGYYQFDGLLAGTYHIQEIHPERFTDGIDHGGIQLSSVGEVLESSIGIPINRFDPVSEATIASLPFNPLYDTIARVIARPGTSAQFNNFSEVLAENEPAPPPPPTPPPPPLPPRPPLIVYYPPPTDVTPPLPPYQVTPTLVYRGLEDVDLFQVRSLSPIRARGFTWHLSVIDGGFPRDSNQPSEGVYAPVWLEAGVDFEYRTGWNVRDMQQLGWTIEDGETSFEFQFGVRNGIPITGDFNGDGISEAGVFFEGHWFIDINGNGQWDENDLWAKLGHAGDLPVTGDWDGDGKDDIGVFGRAWSGDPQAVASEPGLPDRENTARGKAKNMPPEEDVAAHGNRELQRSESGTARSDVIDHVFHFGGIGDRPVAGDWNGDGIDSIGFFNQGQWRLDRNGDGEFTDQDVEATFGQAGDIPIVGDFNGDGLDDIGILRGGTFILDTNGNRRIDAADLQLDANTVDGIPISGDWDGDGTDTVGSVSRDLKFPNRDRIAESGR
ncbi:MAG: hypothetical protein KDA87_23050, partial [Planctomycetales bacterium]|nr:hypothetical protein [Planctomycetales bacterium]